MKNETIDQTADNYARGRLQAIQDLIERLDDEAGNLRAAMDAIQQKAGGDATAKNIQAKVQAAVAQERLSGFIKATEVVVKMFTEEAGFTKNRVERPEPR